MFPIITLGDLPSLFCRRSCKTGLTVGALEPDLMAFRSGFLIGNANGSWSAEGKTPLEAIILTEYGAPDVLRYGVRRQHGIK